MPHQINIKEFAQRIGVSPTTVSRSLNGNGRISSATRARVLARMSELGYTPNVNGQRLVTGRSFMVALKAGYREKPLSNLFSGELVRAIEEGLEAHGYGVLIDTGGGTLGRWVGSHAVDGVIAVGGYSRDNEMALDTARETAARGLPCVVIGHAPVHGEGIGSVVIGLESGAGQVARTLVALGHRRIAHIGTGHASVILAHFRAALLEIGHPLPEENVLIHGSVASSGASAMHDLMTRPDPPTAVFARTDVLAAGAMQAAAALGLRVPENVSVVGHDDLSFAPLLSPPLTSVRVDTGALGKAAIELLCAMFADPAAGWAPRIVPTELIPRDTTGIAPGD